MPYVTKVERECVDPQVQELIAALDEAHWMPGIVNYALSTIIWTWFHQQPSYRVISHIMGTLDSVAKEFYRRKAAPYEDEKARINGDLNIT